jgi:polysaccharide pyruvyl transferase WcaK-like protein
MKAVFTGYYGMQNAGDDAFLEVSAWGAQKYWGADESLFFSPSLPQLQHPAKNLHAFANYGHFAQALWEIARAGIFASAGGSTFHSPLHKTDLRTYAAWKKRLGLAGKTGAIGISLGPYSSAAGEKSTVDYLQRLDFLALRDQASYDLACSYNLPYAPVRAFDLAALLPEVLGEVGKPALARSNHRKIIGISVCYYERYTGGEAAREKKRNDFVEAVLLQLQQNEQLHFRFFIFNGHASMGDEALTRELISKLAQQPGFSYEIVPYLANVAQTYRAVAECDLMFSTRLHASIFACYAGVPFFLNEYHRKCADFLEDVGQAAAYRLYDAQRSSSEVAQLFLEQLQPAVYQPPAHLAETRARALLNFTATISPISA